MTSAALLIALGIVIPMFMPRVTVEPASFTLASHVPVMLAMFISPAVAAAVAVGTTIGFLFSATPVIVVRAATHLVFAFFGALYLKKRPQVLMHPVRSQVFSLAIAFLHAACEVLAVTAFFMAGVMGESYYTHGFMYSVMLMVGVGGMVHSMVDFLIALVIMRVLMQQKQLRPMFVTGQLGTSKA